MSKKSAEELRKQYMEHPPEGMTPEGIREMSEGDLLDMNYSALLKQTIISW